MLTLLANRRQQVARTQALAWLRTAYKALPPDRSVWWRAMNRNLQAETAFRWVPRRESGNQCWRLAIIRQRVTELSSTQSFLRLTDDGGLFHVGSVQNVDR